MITEYARRSMKCMSNADLRGYITLLESKTGSNERYAYLKESLAAAYDEYRERSEANAM